MKRFLVFTLYALLFTCGSSLASSVQFAARELFHVPFGNQDNMLGTKIVNGQLLIPRDFTMDADQHFYIYDSNNHRIVRFRSDGAFEMSLTYPATAKQIFAHPDSQKNLWLLVSDPFRGLYYGVYNTRGKNLHEGIFSQFNKFRLHVDDDYTLHVILSSDKEPQRVQTYLLDQESLLMKKEAVAPPPEEHHQVRRKDRTFYIDPLPGGGKDDSHRTMQITDAAHRSVGSIRGTVVYVTDQGDIYARIGERQINVYDLDGSLKGKVVLEGLAAACAAVRFDPAGNIYELDGIPDKDHQYSEAMPGMRLIVWERR